MSIGIRISLGIGATLAILLGGSALPIIYARWLDVSSWDDTKAWSDSA
jgi:hypothetical protein